jgi:hypothetical protein
VGAPRQSGQIQVSAPADWQVLLGPKRDVRQAEPSSDPSTRRREWAPAFDFSHQPCSLNVRLAPRKTRISVEPEYALLLGAEQAHLKARLKYNVRGGKLSALDIDLDGWQIDEVGPDSLVTLDGIVPAGPATNGNGPQAGARDRADQKFSFVLLQSSEGQFDLKIGAHRKLTAGGKVSLPLLQPQAGAAAALVVLPAAVVVLPAGDVELAPESPMAGLIRQQSEAPQELLKELLRPQLPALEDFSRQQDQLFYRSESPGAAFRAELRRLDQKISVDVNSDMDVGLQAVRVDQKLSYTILHKPAEQLLLDVPRAVAEAGRLELKHEGQPIKADVVQTEGVSTTVRMAARLPNACTRLCHLTARYALPLKVRAEEKTLASVPLIMPANGEVTSNCLNLTTAPELHVQPRPGLWTSTGAIGTLHGQRRSLQLSAEQRVYAVDMEVQHEPAGEAAIVVERAWVQTWLTEKSRADRAVFQLTGTALEVDVALPPGAELDRVCALLDGKRVAAEPDADGRMLLALGAEPGRRVLELRYHFLQRPARGAMDMVLPRLRNAAWVRRLYWQLVLPRHEHVVCSPPGLTHESRWGWNGYFWGRLPLLDQAQLETWTGIPKSRLSPLPAGANCYLFSTVGGVAHCEVRTTLRAWIVLGVSGIVLAAGLLLIYVPGARHPAALLVAVVMLAGLTAMCAEAALLALQAAALGMALVLVAGILSHGLRARRRAVVPVAERGSSAISGGLPSTHSEYRIPSADDQAPLSAPPSTTPPLLPDAEP